MGHWLEDAKELVERVCRTGADRPVWLFSSGPVGDPARKLVQQMGVEEKELQRLIELTGAREHKLFAGRLQRERLNRRRRAALLVMRGMEGDFRDWGQIEQWARGIAGSLDSSALAVGAR
jgi:menaquinone-dependent protoporphyrinogen oxidase